MKANLHQPALLIFLVVTLTSSCGGGGGDGTPNTTPVANAGPDQTALNNVLVVLDGSSSIDADGNALTYSWTLNSKPAGSSASISNPTSVAPTFNTDIAGTYTINLVVNDGIASSSPATVNIVALSSVSNIHDTGLQKCYDNSAVIACPTTGSAFNGQDAQYSTNPMRFVDNGTTVSDSFTGLMWQKTDSATKYNWYQAMGIADSTLNNPLIDVCGSSTLGSFTDWRLPTRKELVSIMSYAGGFSPDQTYFQGVGLYWSSTLAGTSSISGVWVVGGSVVANALGYQNGLAAAYDVKCVRGTTLSTSSYTDNLDGTVTDASTGLRWQKGSDGIARNWQNSLAYCQNLSLAGLSNWRLPDIKELDSIVNTNSLNYTQPVDLTFFTLSTETNGLSFYWSSTTDPASTGAALGIDFRSNTVTNGGFGKTSFKFTRCVR